MVADLESIRIFRARVTCDLCALSTEPRPMTFCAHASPRTSTHQPLCKWHSWQPVCVFFKQCSAQQSVSLHQCRLQWAAVSTEEGKKTIFSSKKQEEMGLRQVRERRRQHRHKLFRFFGQPRCCFINPNELQHLSARGMWPSLPFCSPLQLTPILLAALPLLTCGCPTPPSSSFVFLPGSEA